MDLINLISRSFTAQPLLYIVACALMHIIIAAGIFQLRRKKRILKRHSIAPQTPARQRVKNKQL